MRIVERLPWPIRWLLGWRRFDTAQQATDHLRDYLERTGRYPRGTLEYDRLGGERFTDTENLPFTLVTAIWLAEELQFELADACAGGRKGRIGHREAAHKLRADREALMLRFHIPEINGKPVKPVGGEG